LLSTFLETYRKEGILKAVKFAEDNTHNSLWKILAEKALEELDYKTAEKALLKIDDYKALKLIKRIESLDDKDKQKAEVLAYYGRYDDAEAIYKKIDRKDLAVQMRVKIGDWFRVLQMIREGSGYDETLLKITDELGNFYAEKFKWDRAAEFYLLSKNYKGLIEAFTRMEDYENLSQVITEIPENDPLLVDLAERFQMVGMAEYAVKCYERAGTDQVSCGLLCAAEPLEYRRRTG
jgi:WD repeat-containing protein 35